MTTRPSKEQIYEIENASRTLPPSSSSMMTASQSGLLGRQMRAQRGGTELSRRGLRRNWGRCGNREEFNPVAVIALERGGNTRAASSRERGIDCGRTLLERLQIDLGEEVVIR